MNEYELITDDPTEGKRYLVTAEAKAIDAIETDTFTRTKYEIDTESGTEVWIERESKLEPPEYFYSLKRFVGTSE